MTAPELKPCPFCGETQPPHDDTSWVRCLGCGAETGWQPTGDEAIAAWNRRADLAQPAQVRVKTGEIERAVWSAMAWAVRHAKQLPGDIMPAYTDSGNSDAETACRTASARILAAIEPQPDPRDEVIARLVDALEWQRDQPEAHPFMKLQADAALASAKAVQHG